MRGFLVLVPVESAIILLGGNKDCIEQSRAGQTAGRHLLQANTERQHGDERCNPYGDAYCCQTIAQLRLPQIAHGEFEHVIAFHARTSSETSLPSARKIKR